MLPVFKKLTLPFAECSADDDDCVWNVEYRNWCDSFSAYQRELDQYNCLKVSPKFLIINDTINVICMNLG